MTQKGIIHLALPLFLLALIVALAVGLVFFGILPNPFKSVPGLTPQEPTVTLQKTYENPFDKSSQYVNPFSEYKNPFDSLK